MKKILITGGTGFIGKKLMELINNKSNIRILSRNNKSNESANEDLLKKETIKEAFKEIKIVIHLAFSKNYPENIIMAKNLVEISKKNKIKKIILVSSMAAKRAHPDEYGIIKQEVERIIKNSGIKYTILRPSIVYGKGSSSFNFIIERLKKLPFVPIIGNGRYLIYPVHVDDVVKSIVECIDNNKTDFKDYDLPGGEGVYFINLINELKKQLKIKKPNIKIPIFICNILAKLFPKIISKENIQNLTQDSLADIKSAYKDLKYNPRKFQEGVKDGII